MDFNKRILHAFPGNIPLPYYMAYPGYMGAESEKDIMKDLEYLQQTYPVQVRKYQKKVSDVVDRLDYEGSMIYDEYPDRYELQRLALTIASMMAEKKEMDSDMVNREESDQNEKQEKKLQTDDTFVYLAQVLLCDEIYRRRQNKCKYQNRFWCGL